MKANSDKDTKKKVAKKKKQHKQTDSFLHRFLLGGGLVNLNNIIFFILLAYSVYAWVNYATKEKYNYYEVTSGSLEESERYSGVILRDEQSFRASADGYISYYILDKKRVPAGAKVYYISADEQIAQLIEANTDSSMEISSQVYTAVKNELSGFVLGYNDDNFKSVYDTKYALDLRLAEYTGMAGLESVEKILTQKGVNYIEDSTDRSGTFSVTTDTLTGKTLENVDDSFFDASKNEVNNLRTGMKVKSGSQVYKLVQSDYWNIVFKMTQKQFEKYADKKVLNIYIPSADIYLKAGFSMHLTEDGKTYAVLSFDKFMIEFINDRYIDFEIIADKNEGLKIPQSSVVDKDFFLIPMDYATRGANGLGWGFNKEWNEDGVKSIRFVPADIYYTDNEQKLSYVKVDDESLFAGDVLIKPGSDEVFVVQDVDILSGVYIINKGYTQFKVIEVIAADDEFLIIKEGTSYGLSVYDHILSNPAGYDEGVVLYK